MLHNLHKILFEGESYLEEYEEIPTFKTEWEPTDKDWYTVIFKLNKHINLIKWLKRIKDPDKVIRYYKCAQALNWKSWDEFYDTQIRQFMRAHIITYDEMEIINVENIPIPEKWLETIEMIKQDDKTGGLTTNEQNIGKFGNDEILWDAFNYVGDIISYDFVNAEQNPYNEYIRCIRLHFRNGSIAVIKVKWSGTDFHDLKANYNCDDHHINKDRFRIKLAIVLSSYKEQKIIDDDWIIKWG